MPLAIVLAGTFKQLPFDKILDAIMQMDEKELSPQHLQALTGIVPQQEEVRWLTDDWMERVAPRFCCLMEFLASWIW